MNLLSLRNNKVVEVKSLNCNSCGGPLSITYETVSKCLYCGNTNKILDNGKTEIITIVTDTKSKLTAAQVITIGVIGVVFLGLFFYMLKKKEDKQRNYCK